MVLTRSQKENPTPDQEIAMLRDQLLTLEQENQSLLLQFELVCSENDNLSAQLKHKHVKAKKSKELSKASTASTQTTISSFDAYDAIERNITCEIIEALISQEYDLTVPAYPHTVVVPTVQNNITHTVPIPSHTVPSRHTIPSQHAASSQQTKTGPKRSTRPTKVSSQQASKSKSKQSKHEKDSHSKRRPRTIVIGTSLVRDISLSENGMDGIIYSYPGQYVPFIQSRVRYILEDECPDFIVLQCGGNDLERHQNSDVIIQYERLIATVKSFAPYATIILGSVPPRGKDHQMQDKIDKFNTYLSNRAKQSDNVNYFAGCPVKFVYFKQDLTHFNDSGSTIYSQKLASMVHHLHSFPLPQSKRRT